MKIYLPLVIMMLTVQMLGVEIWSNDIDQQRPVMHVDNRLMAAADYKARLIAESGKVAHCIDNYCPNEMIEDFGCKTGYSENSNFVESIAVGDRKITDAYLRLKNSPAHRPHILGLGFFNSQDEIGVGYYEFNNNYYYVFISANCLE